MIQRLENTTLTHLKGIIQHASTSETCSQIREELFKKMDLDRGQMFTQFTHVIVLWGKLLMEVIIKGANKVPNSVGFPGWFCSGVC